MCTTCGCAEGERRIEGDDHEHHHSHEHHHGSNVAHTTVIHHHYHHQGHVHHHIYPKGEMPHCHESIENNAVDAKEIFQPSEAENHLHYGHGEAGTHAPGMTQRRMLQIEMDVLGKNNHIAEHNRQDFADKNIVALNLVSSPGSGKTTLLTETLLRLRDKFTCAVIEGDQQTTNDAERIRATGVAAIQVNTGKGCHLDAQMVKDAMQRLALIDNSLLFIENVGNLVCPASFDLGERAKVAVLSVTEGEDKPLKYPHMFAASKIMLLNKIDLLPHLNFDVEACIANAKRINPDIEVIEVSAKSGQGMDIWLTWLESQLCA